MKIYLLPIFLLAACDQNQDQRAAQERHDGEMRRDQYDQVAKPTTSNPIDTPRTNNPQVVEPTDVDGSDNPPFLQSEKAEDVKLTADIRKAVLAADGLSMSADNVQIITRDGAVLLRGMVNTQAEKDAVEKIAREAAGTVRVDNQITVRPPT